MSGFRYDADGKPLWHAPLPNPAWDAGDRSASPFSVCQFCGEPWPCGASRAQSEPVPVTGIWLRSAANGTDLEVLAEFDGEWRTVIRQHYIDGDLISHIVEPLGMRHTPGDRLARATEGSARDGG